ncbi:MAG: GDP-mannose 4,6-dehydratase [Terracidiphilus sp.]
MERVALITGITGQGGAYLARPLLKKGFMVHGIKRRSSSLNTGRIDSAYQDPHFSEGRMRLHYGDMTDATNSVRIIQSFAGIGRKIEWRGTGVDEVGVDVAGGQALVRVDSRYFRPTEVDELLGDSSKASRVLGWRYTTSFQELVQEMLQSDLGAIKQAAETREVDRE